MGFWKKVEPGIIIRNLKTRNKQRMNLSKVNLGNVSKDAGASIPGESYFNLPEKVLQFGTGVLLRGLPDYFIDKANKEGVFNGRIVVVKSTSNGGTDAFTEQDGLYTLCVRGIENGESVDKLIVNAAISRVLSASEEWAEILKCASNPEMKVITSNTTEVGIVLVEDDIHAAPPVSFPGKLLAFLYQRYKAFNGSADSGMAIVPTELITDNGKLLKEVVLEQAKRNNLEADFINWLTTANDFCNTLVDRIVPGKLPASEKAAVEAKLGYTDDLMIMSEVYRLWAIETENERTKSILSFSQVDPGVILTPDITKFKELKLRLLNGSHTFTCGLAVIRGFGVVKEAMKNEAFAEFISTLMKEEIIPAIVSADITKEEATQFANNVLDRYRNPFIEHQWLGITAQYSLKMKGRNLDTIKNYYKKNDGVPQHFATGFAAYILFMRSTLKENGSYVGKLNGKEYTITDQHASVLHGKWQQYSGIQLVNSVLEDNVLWGESIAQLPGFADAVYNNMQQLIVDYKIEIAEEITA